MSYKAILLGILLVLAVPAPSWALTHLIATISGTELCPSSEAPSKFKLTMEIEIIEVGQETDIRIATDVFDNNSLHVDMTGVSNIQNGNHTGGNISFFSPVAGSFNGTYKNDANNNITSLTGTIVAQFSDGCTKISTIKAKPGTF